MHDSLQWTTQQKRNARNYRAGQVVIFTRATGTWKAGQCAEVRSVDPADVVTLSAVGGAVCMLPLRSAESFDVGLPRRIEVAMGDKLLVRANDKRVGLVNGQVLTVDRIEANGAIVTHEGQRIPSTFRQWCHGYVITSHKAQGRTCEHVVVAAERLDAKAAYVACSRGRSSCSVHTPDKERLLARLSEGSRRAALDTLTQAQAVVRLSAAPSLVARLEAWVRLRAVVVHRVRTSGASLKQRLKQISADGAALGGALHMDQPAQAGCSQASAIFHTSSRTLSG